MADFIIVTILVVVVFFILRGQFQKRGKGECGGGCAGCSGCKSCGGNNHTKTQAGKTEGEMSRQ